MDSDYFDAEQYVRSLGSIFAKFDKQDSGNISYGVEIQGRRYFIKTAGRPSDPHVTPRTDERL